MKIKIKTKEKRVFKAEFSVIELKAIRQALGNMVDRDHDTQEESQAGSTVFVSITEVLEKLGY